MSGGPALSRDTVVSRALAVLDDGGLDALGIRGLAADLGVTPMAIYWHVRDKNDLLDAVLDAALAGVELSDLVPGDPRQALDDLTILAGRYRQVFAEHPGAARVLALRQGRGVPGPAAVRVSETAGALLGTAGLSAAAASSGVALVAHFLMGTVVMDFGTPQRPSPAERAASDDRFAFGMQVLSAGLHELARTTRPAPPGRH